MSFANSLEAGGGTNIPPRSYAGIAMFEGSAERPRVIVFMTDGISRAPAITDTGSHLASASEATTRATPALHVRRRRRREPHHARALGAENRGAADFVGTRQDIETMIGGFYATISRPVLSDLSFDFGDR